jgi:cyclohexyl-isocyanide hydratase
MTALDFIGVYDPLVRLKRMGFLPALEWDICGTAEKVHDSTGLHFKPTKVNEDLGSYDMVVIPGGEGSRRLLDDDDFIAWLATASSCKRKASVCTGALLMGAAGFLRDRRATTHPSAMRELKRFCRAVVPGRIVDEGEVITAGGVTAAIDLGLYLCEELAGQAAKEQIRRQMDYHDGAS